ncbi:MAG: hypothetical protein NTZ48_04710, partial [Candidatus Omnitrophica bacterium]|nr:hypothetical protein [Candidatus Omnitrophota bacterium]
LLLLTSFLGGVFFRRAEINLRIKQTDAAGKDVLRFSKALREEPGIPSDSNVAGEELSKAVKDVSNSQKHINEASIFCFRCFIAGVFFLALGFMAILFRTELHQLKIFLSGKSVCHSQRILQVTIPAQ